MVLGAHAEMEITKSMAVMISSLLTILETK